MSEIKMHAAAEVIKNPEIVAGRYAIIYDQTLTGFKFDNMVKALNFLQGRGWKCINITATESTKGVTGLYMYALMERST